MYVLWMAAPRVWLSFIHLASNGFIARERVTIANLTIPDQTMGIVTDSNVTLTDRTTGLLGLGFPRLSGINQTVTNCQ